MSARKNNLDNALCEPSAVGRLITEEGSYTCGRCGRVVKNYSLHEVSGKQLYGRMPCKCRRPAGTSAITQGTLPLEATRYDRRNGFAPDPDLSDMPY